MTDVEGCAAFLVSFQTAQLEPNKIVPMLCVGMPLWTLCVLLFAHW